MAKTIKLEIDLLKVLTDYGWIAGHAPDGVKAERIKYRTEDGEWQAFHKPHKTDEYWCAYLPKIGGYVYVNFSSRQELQDLLDEQKKNWSLPEPFPKYEIRKQSGYFTEFG